MLTLGAGLAIGSLDPDDSVPALLFLGVVGFSARDGGLGRTLVATAFGSLAIDYVFERPRYVLAVTSTRTIVDMRAFLLMSVLVGVLHHRLRLSTTRLATERDRAEAGSGHGEWPEGVSPSGSLRIVCTRLSARDCRSRHSRSLGGRAWRDRTCIRRHGHRPITVKPQPALISR